MENILTLKQIMNKMNEYTNNEKNYKDREIEIIEYLSKLTNYKTDGVVINFDGKTKTNDYLKQIQECRTLDDTIYFSFDKDSKKNDYYTGVTKQQFIGVLENFFKKMSENRMKQLFFAKWSSDFCKTFSECKCNVEQTIKTKKSMSKKSFLSAKNRRILRSVLKNIEAENQKK